MKFRRERISNVNILEESVLGIIHPGTEIKSTKKLAEIAIICEANGRRQHDLVENDSRCERERNAATTSQR